MRQELPGEPTRQYPHQKFARDQFPTESLPLAEQNTVPLPSEPPQDLTPPEKESLTPPEFPPLPSFSLSDAPKAKQEIKTTFDREDQEKTKLFQQSGWSSSSEGSILQFLKMENIEKPDRSIYLLIAEAPNAHPKSLEFVHYTQIVPTEKLGSVVFPNLSHINVPQPEYMFYVLQGGRFQECERPQALGQITPGPQEVAA